MKERGFVGILVLLIMIAVLASFVILPCIFRSRVESSEASAVGSLRTIVVAEQSYREAGWKNDAGVRLGYSLNLADLGCWLGDKLSRTSSCLVDDVLARATSAKTAKSGYVYTRTNHGAGFTVNGNPATPGTRRYFFADQTGVIRFNSERTANVNDTPLQ